MWILYIGILIPLFFTLLLIIKFRERTHVVEIAGLWVVSIGIIFMVKVFSEKITSMEIEYWGEYGVKIEYYEQWDEWIHQTCTTVDSEGNVSTYDCSYRSYHPPYWTVITNTGNQYNISQSQFLHYSSLWKNKKFIDLKRGYYRIDGDKYESQWNKVDDLLFPIITTHRYENRVVNSSSIYDFLEIDTSEVKIFSYPKIHDYTCNSIMSQREIREMKEADKRLTFYNAKYGSGKEVRMWLLIFHNKPFQYSMYQEHYWKGGSKNEVVVCVGVDDMLRVEWVKCFSWSEKENFKVNLRDSIMNQGKLNLMKTVEVMKDEVMINYERREFKEFEYLEVEPPFYIIFLSLLSIFVLVGGMTVYIIFNQFDSRH